jgi:hypothetical protein
MVWRYAITGMNIALYRDKGRLRHSLLNHSNSENPGRLFPITPDSVESEVKYLLGPQHLRVPGAEKMKLNALSKTCRAM